LAVVGIGKVLFQPNGRL